MSTRPDPDKKVSPNWKPVAALDDRRPGMLWSDRLYHATICLAGLAIAAVGVLIVAGAQFFVDALGSNRGEGLGRFGSLFIIVGSIVFALGFPSEAQRRGYRE